MNIEKLTEASALLDKAVTMLYEADQDDTYELGFGFADTTADNVKDFVSRYEKRMAWLASPSPVTGYLLELHMDGEWVQYEFDCMEKSNLGISEHPWDEFMNEQIEVGMYKALPNVHVRSSDDWDFRLGVNFDARHTPNEFVSPINTWGGEVKERIGGDYADLWRVTKITISGEMSDDAKKFFAKHMWIYWNTNNEEGETK